MGKWRHRLSNKNVEDSTANCESCGVVSIVKTGKIWRCKKAKRATRTGGMVKPDDVVCEICGSDYVVSWDHCHDSGNFRGWLCMHCNTALGLVKDDPIILERMIAYLKEKSPR